MGRPKGDGARSKARPSSSSLAASLLPSASAVPPAVGFGGYVGGSRLDPSLPNEESTSFLDVDSEVAQHLKRLSRKDPTTKIKALASLSELMKQKQGKELLPILPQWTFEYKKLILDYSREVRRATHDVMTNIVTVVRRDLAPHLKSIMGPWWFSQFDLASEVSQAAKSSFQAAFPAQEKRLDALNLCAADIFAYLEENLKLTPQNLSDKVLAPDELEEMYHQVTSSSLLALATLLDVLLHESDRPGLVNTIAESKLASKAMKSAISSAEKLFSSHKCFVDFLKSQSPSVRSAAYSVLRSLIKNVPEVFSEGDVRSLAPTVLGVFQENNPICHSSMWEALLLFSKNFPQSWTCLNVQKSVLNPFWQFLRNGCFGSQQISYPSLILCLEVMPTLSVEVEHFFVEFFDNLLAGRNMFGSSSTDHVALFCAIKECFLWGLHNASRYCDGPDSIHDLKVALVDKVLVKLLWQDFFELPMDRNPPIQIETTEALSANSPILYLQELGRCIIEILSGIYMLDHKLLSVFCMSVQESILKMFQKENLEVSDAYAGKMIDFLLLLEKYSVREGESWPLDHFVGPLLSKTFPWIKSLELLNGLKLLSISISVFGPRNIVPELMGNKQSPILSGDNGWDISPEKFMEVFREIFIPWCMDGNDFDTTAKLDLLLSLIDDECFTQQWNDVISYAFSSPHIGSNNLVAVTMLLEKAKDEISKRKFGRIGSQPDHWHHELLESTAVTLVCSSPSSKRSAARFLCSLLGGSTENVGISFIPRNSMVLIYRGVLEKLLSFIKQYSFNSMKETCSSIIAEGGYSVFDADSPLDLIKMAEFAAEVLDGSFFSLKALNEDASLLATILASVFIIGLENRMTTVMVSNSNELTEMIKARLYVSGFISDLQSKMDKQFWESICYEVRKRLASILIRSIRSVVLHEDELCPAQFSSLCASWMLEVLECLSLDENDERNLWDLLLLESDLWPMWVCPKHSAIMGIHDMPVHLCELRKSKIQRFVSFINTLIVKMGIRRFFVRYQDNKSSSRAWLAAEMLCTWEWPGGSVQSSFLPTLISYSKNEPSDGVLLNSIFDILLNGALAHEENDNQSLTNTWIDLSNDVGDVKEPFLRALLSFLFTLFKENIWGGEEAAAVFKTMTDKLFIGEETSKNCLRIIPLIMKIIILPLHSRNNNSDVHFEDIQQELDVVLRGWLQKTLLFPPLVIWRSEEDMQDWFQLVISCYPVSEKTEEANKQERCVSNEERTLLLNLFRKQKQGPNAASVVNRLPAVQTLLSKLIVISVRYCGNDFNEEDWEFVFSNLKRLIQSAVVGMEETSENINGFITGISSAEKVNETLQRLWHIASVTDPSIDNAKNALSAFSSFNALLKHKLVEDEVSLTSLTNETWDPVKDRILEGILRLFFCTGLAEAIADSYSHEAASIIASSRFNHLHFWELVASLVVDSSPRALDRAVKAVEFWGLSKGAISSLYAILFSSKPIPSLQFAAYVVLSTEPISRLAIVAEGSASLNEEVVNNQDSGNVELPSEERLCLRDEISCMVEKLTYEFLDTDLTAPERVQTFLAWSLLLSHVSSLPPLSQRREKLVEHIQSSANPVILDCLFQHIPLELCNANSLKKKDADLLSELSVVASAATRAITTGSSLSSVKSLWPIQTDQVASLAGALYGLMLRVLPAYVREWFSELRDRSASTLIEAFTRSWCSPPLIKNELSQIKKADFNDESFSVSVSKSANEVVATYTKDETGMDLVIHLPVSYPLRPVDVDCMRSLGISEVKQRKWLMSMIMFVRNQNGALAEAIRIWKRNFDKEFEGVEECPICYSVIHTVNHNLPRLACKTCKHKFHSACLYKWFSTSHKSACPLCQSPF
ncbi:PREDICTED: LOW QUALITY PROTEIN: E3 ubiquitin-protein ligase listerin [Tarenaya hassleriana]|uniref:LOW QUALITY PROTEIN: E3 ubiquitin-protein ligase listerin n=1 Tax=Tarenaya hassleriana TaxID=28532 RepID=UPI00053C9CDC|nr:PREDICTED: LOW QUALITY PROTEIN: E3 ubiquitin-protein ligase listerin [Tarenaya hassleriana]